jgi:hypothetical protein
VVRQGRATAGRAAVARRPGDQQSPGCRPLPLAGGDRRSAAGRRSQPVCTFFFTFLSKKKVTFFFKKKFRPLHVARAWTSCGGVCTVSHFLKCAPILGSANSSKFHGEWRFHFFPNFFFPKFTSYMDLHICRWDFCFMKKLIP